MAYSILGQQIADASRSKGEHNDCTVRALAVHLGGDYDTAWKALNARGRRSRHGAYDWQWIPAYRDCGLSITPTQEFTSRTVRTLERELARKARGRKILIKVRQHVAAWDGEKLVDWTSGRQHRIKTVYVIEGGNAAPQPQDEPQPPAQPVKPQPYIEPRAPRHSSRSKLAFVRRTLNEMYPNGLPQRINKQAALSILKGRGLELAPRTLGQYITKIRNEG